MRDQTSVISRTTRLINIGSQWSAAVEMRFGLIKRSDELSVVDCTVNFRVNLKLN